ncbi:MAG TPA: hypothetical protein VM511_01520 [Luteolibacter sp.]|nr:hypothetical protein [Luteolibacter sp.]
MNPLHRRILTISGGVLLLVAVALVLRSPDKPEPTPEKKTIQAKETASRPQKRPESGGPMTDPGKVAGEITSASPNKSGQAALDEVFNLSVQYSEESVPLIAPYLTDPDLKVRAAALEGMLNNGKTSGAAHLRAAAKKLEDPVEAAAYIKAAEHLELPSANDFN